MKIQKAILSRLWALTLTGALALNLGACSGRSTPAATEASVTTAVTQAPTETTIPETQPPETEPKKEFYQVGDTLEIQNFEITYLASGVYTDQLYSPGPGNQFIFLKFRVTNLSSSVQWFDSRFFQCYYDGNFIGMGSTGGPDISYSDVQTLAGNIPAGRTITRWAYFEVPAQAQEFEVEYDETYFTRQYDHSPVPDFIPKFLYEGELDSGLNEAGNPSPAPDAVQVGDSVEFRQFKVTYLSCYLDHSISIPAKEGYHYVTCECEYENLCSDSLFITDFCFADGLNCRHQVFVRNSNLFVLPAGEKASELFTFEVPDGSTVVECEHLVDSVMIVFDASNPAE